MKRLQTNDYLLIVTNLAQQPVLVLKPFRPPSHVLCPPVNGAHLEGLEEGPRVKPALEYVSPKILLVSLIQKLHRHLHQ